MNLTRLIDSSLAWLDRLTGNGSRRLARATSRRSFLTRLGTMLTGAAILPLLPVARALSAESVQEMGDPQSCDYWRYCALGGTLCSCCGGTMNSCPPGSEPSPIAWVGTCRNPVDDRDYLISYNDCCGKSVCERCGCHNTERERPVYYPSKTSSVLWCFGTESRAYHCTVGVVLGEAGGAG
ncbi:MAG: methylamine dehydrogenase (amicyanin) light chain [Gammaproteobacteria bacterium]|nr:methylamine dehydrogenase (amicyanin) light chain [Gammaproteobacteria bacterium]MDH4253614.1 methylamine dehydrogenase (amicyanin) light chain [Gammaproteobacteria bacterium]MDH5310377.1 methylamine dehydrogenase (amicyanin) light chain [Gammaproteobacteria bacterium]